LKKVRSCLQEGIDHLHQARDNFANAAQKLEIQQESASSQIDALLSGTSQKLKSECHDQLTETKTVMRAAIYDYIDSDQSNDDFKERLTAEIEELKTSVGNDLEARFAKVFEMFKHEAGEIIRKNQKNVDEILHFTIDGPFSSLKLSFTTDFKMDNGINVVGIISTLGGAAVLVWGAFLASNPVGWTIATVLGAVGLVFTFYKAVRSFFSSDYKKEQQRKSADDNFDKVFSKVTEMLDNNLESASAKINEALLETKKQMRLPYEQSVNTQTALEEITAKMMALRDKLIPRQTFAAATATTTTVTKAAAVIADPA
jgi:cell division protein FtsL